MENFLVNINELTDGIVLYAQDIFNSPIRIIPLILDLAIVIYIIYKFISNYFFIIFLRLIDISLAEYSFLSY